MWNYANILILYNDCLSRCDKAYINLCQDHFDFNTGFTIDAVDMMSIINALSCIKSPGLDGFTAELLVLLSALVFSILVHGYVPKVITESVIIPVIKDKNRRVNDKSNYRPICLSNICSKIVEAVLLNRMDVYL